MDVIIVTKPLDFSRKSVLVVGGSSGIGNAIAQAFRMHGAAVHVWGRRARRLSNGAEDDSDLEGLEYQCVDVTDPLAVEAAQPNFSALDVLVLSQGIVLYGRQEYEISGFRSVLEVNLISLMAVSLKFREALAACGGSLIIVSSTAAFHATIGNPAYNASKAGAAGLTRTLAAAWAQSGIRVNGIAPGLVDTKLTRITTTDPERLDAFRRKIPVGRLGLAQEMAGVALFLASPLASYVVGQTIVVDGGLTLQ
jgi:3-oxoacyl-[acyl-carrier protein] reductase